MLFNAFLIGVGGHLFMNYFFPTEYHNFIFTISLHSILVYSYCEIYVKKYMRHPYFKMIKSAIFTDMSNSNTIEIIKDGQVICNTNKETINANLRDSGFDLVYDLIILSDIESMTEEKPVVNKIILYNIPLRFDYNFDYSLCKFAFISIVLKVKNATWPIKLTTNAENYYVVGNAIGTTMISYLLKKQHNEILEKGECYELTIIDQDINLRVINEKEIIVFQERTYHILPMDTRNHTTEVDINKKTQ